jgi:mono/diheme cytochrome c family protein
MGRARGCWVIRALAVWAAFSCCPIARSAEPSAADVALGRDAYNELCAACHGRDMVIAGGLAFDLRRFPAEDLERFRKAVIEGKGPAMPAWRDKITEDDLNVLWAYVRSGGKAD